ncbi:sensor domain-containing diguanylate cyclase [Lysobacter spongiae]|uniref:Sensor domain-containing diguanylate cyclase n=2 Tax=Marilutibacter spongiae TaxID=2025720 RepID=A0A7W3TN97_9GAMM|nr:sensor domain-containing diguanylate cyclase [Lysobacter spongiae]MBB1061473.1 sensor domain-containing diguanylate cyclase [Lysobacter spongiae]
MPRPAKPDNEAARLKALHRHQILDTGAESSFDDLVTIAAAICGMPMGAVSLVDAERQWFKARIGLDETETSRDVAFCAHAILDPHEVMIVRDARDDDRFRDNPVVTGSPGIRFYAGAPLVDVDGMALGSLCVMDHEPRDLAPYQRDALNALSRQVSALLELRRVSHALRMQLQERDWYEDQLSRFSDELELQNADLNEQVRLDALTRLPNRRALGVALEQALAEGQPFCLALLDIDHFKTVNDTHGHAAGDEVLVQVADVLRATSAGFGLVSRHGGEEFAWLLPEADLERARIQCEYLREAVAFASEAMPVTISVGLARRAPDDTVGDLMSRADKALYAAKHGGRNRVVSG